MKVALLTIEAGVSQTLATTAFVLAMADGLDAIGVDVRVVGLTRSESRWRPEALEPFETSAPWVGAGSPRFRDELAAARLGVTDSETGQRFVTGEDVPAWYLEFLLQRELEEFAGADPDLAVVLYPISHALLHTVARITRRTGWKLIVQSCEAMSGSWIDPVTRDDYIRGVAADADGVWALSEYLADYWKAQGVAPDRVLVCPNVVRRDAFRDDPPPRAHAALYLGNLQHREINYLLDISESASAQVPGYHLTIYGDATADRRRELSGILSARGLTHAVSIMDPVLPSQIPGLLKSADVLLLPRSSGEFSTAGFPNKLGEYLASGRPVVATRVGDIPKYLVDGESAFLVEPDDCAAFTKALVTALNDPAAADMVGTRGRHVADELLASPVVAQHLVSFIEGLPSASRAEKPVSAWDSPSWRVVREMRYVAPRLVRSRADALVRASRKALRKVRYARTGHTRVMALKIAIVEVLRFLHLKPPAPRA